MLFFFPRFILGRRGGGSAAEDSTAYLWNSAEGPHPKGRAISGTRAPLPPAEAGQVACKWLE